MWSGELGTWMRVSMAISSGLLVVSVLGGVALLKRRLIGRTLSLAYEIASIVHSVVFTSLTAELMQAALIKGLRGSVAAAGEFVATVTFGVYVGSVGVGVLINLVFIVLLTRPPIRAYLVECERVAGQPAAR